MASGKPMHLFFGIALLVVGSLLGLIVARAVFGLARSANKWPDAWLIGGLAFFTALSTFFIWVGTREFQRASGQEVSKPNFRWGRLLAGASLIFFSLKGHFAPDPDAFKADNEAQAAGMMTAMIGMIVVGMVLIGLSFKRNKRDPQFKLTETGGARGPNTRIS